MLFFPVIAFNLFSVNAPKLPSILRPPFKALCNDFTSSPVEPFAKTLLVSNVRVSSAIISYALVDLLVIFLYM